MPQRGHAHGCRHPCLQSIYCHCHKQQCITLLPAKAAEDGRGISAVCSFKQHFANVSGWQYKRSQVLEVKLVGAAHNSALALLRFVHDCPFTWTQPAWCPSIAF